MTKSQNQGPQNRKSVFDIIRGMLRRGFRKEEVKALDNAIDNLTGQGTKAVPNSPPKTVPSVSSGRTHERRVADAGVALIKKFEGCARLRTNGMIEAYPDPGSGGDPWTIGWGSTGIAIDGHRIARGTVWTQQQCDAQLDHHLIQFANEVSDAIGNAPTTQNQFDAMVSFQYNTGAIAKATLTKKHIAGDYAGADREFARWNKAQGRVMRGLVRRRAAEAALYRT